MLTSACGATCAYVTNVQVIWDRYVRAMQEARFSESVGVYVASGLLTYGASQGEGIAFDTRFHGCRPRNDWGWGLQEDIQVLFRFWGGLTLCFWCAEMAVIEDKLKRHRLCSGTHHKEMYLPTHELEGGGSAVSLSAKSTACPYFLA